LQRATTLVREDERVKGKILRIFKIWEQRSIYSEEFVTDLYDLLKITPAKKSVTPTKDLVVGKTEPLPQTSQDIDDFQVWFWLGVLDLWD
jgi:hypothetical protein